MTQGNGEQHTMNHYEHLLNHQSESAERERRREHVRNAQPITTPSTPSQRRLRPMRVLRHIASVTRVTVTALRSDGLTS